MKSLRILTFACVTLIGGYAVEELPGSRAQFQGNARGEQCR